MCIRDRGEVLIIVTVRVASRRRRVMTTEPSARVRFFLRALPAESADEKRADTGPVVAIVHSTWLTRH